MVSFPNDLKKIFSYHNGELVYKVTRNSRAKKGSVAGCIDSSNGYKEVRLDYTRYYVHRLIWVYFNGDIPKGYSIDHINHNTLDNRIENLRLVKHKDNIRNQRIHTNNTTGATGVTFIKTSKKWLAQIMVDYKQINLGRFDTLEEALSMRLCANDHYGFHDNHGGV